MDLIRKAAILADLLDEPIEEVIDNLRAQAVVESFTVWADRMAARREEFDPWGTKFQEEDDE